MITSKRLRSLPAHKTSSGSDQQQSATSLLCHATAQLRARRDSQLSCAHELLLIITLTTAESSSNTYSCSTQKYTMKYSPKFTCSSRAHKPSLSRQQKSSWHTPIVAELADRESRWHLRDISQSNFLLPITPLQPDNTATWPEDNENKSC